MANVSKKAEIKPIKFWGSSLEDLRDFPEDARRNSGHQLDRVQHGLEPEDFKTMATVGFGVIEIRIRENSGIYRVFYVAKFEDAVHVLHCFQKKTQQTAKNDIDLGRKRYQDLIKEPRQ